MLEGWVFRYKTLPDGRRQVLNYGLAGDLIGVQGALYDVMQHSIEALSALAQLQDRAAVPRPLL